jgi:hypothetical protein
LGALHSRRVSRLILGRPAWVDAPSLETMAPYLEVAQLLKDYGAREGAHRFETSQTLALLKPSRQTMPDRCAGSSLAPIQRARSRCYHASLGTRRGLAVRCSSKSRCQR